MGKKQKKKATEKEISQKTCAAENKEDKSGIDSCSCDSLSGACNDEDSVSKVLDLDEAIKKIEDQRRSISKSEALYKGMKEQMEIMNEFIKTKFGIDENLNDLSD